MDMRIVVPLISQIVGKDISGEIDLFFRARASVGDALNDEGQKFFIANWRSMADFMGTEEGMKATSEFVQAWADKLNPGVIVMDAQAVAAPENKAK